MTPTKFIAIRKSAGLSQTIIADLLRKSRSTIARYEGGNIPIPHLVERFMIELEQINDNRMAAD